MHTHAADLNGRDCSAGDIPAPADGPGRPHQVQWLHPGHAAQGPRVSARSPAPGRADLPVWFPAGLGSFGDLIRLIAARTSTSVPPKPMLLLLRGSRFDVPEDVPVFGVGHSMGAHLHLLIGEPAGRKSHACESHGMLVS